MTKDICPKCHCLGICICLEEINRELLEACEKAFDNLQRRSETRQKWTCKDQDAFEALQTAIKKAKGG